MLAAKHCTNFNNKPDHAAQGPKPGRDKPAQRPAPPNPLWHRLAAYGGGETAVSASSGSGLLNDVTSAEGGILAPLVQPKLHIGAANDRFEQEADRVADRVMRMPTAAVQAKPT